MEYHWEENPGYVFAATAGMFGLILAISLMLNAGWGLNEPVPGDQSPEIADDSADAELGEPLELNNSIASRFPRRGFEVEEADETPAINNEEPDDDFPEMITSRPLPKAEPDDEESPETEDTADPFAESTLFSRNERTDPPTNRRNVELPMDLEEEEEQFLPPVRETATEPPTSPRISLDLDEEEESPAEELPTRSIAQNDRLRDDDDPPTDLTTESDLEEDSASRPPALLRTNGELESEKSEARDLVADEDSIVRPTSPPIAETVPEKKSPTPAETSEDDWQPPVRESVPPRSEPPPSPRPETVAILPREKPISKGASLPGKPIADLPVQMAITGPGRVNLNDSCSYILSITNTGKSPLQNLVLSIELPPSLVHEVSQSIEQDIRTIPAGASHQALIKLQAKSSGTGIIRADVSSGRRVAMQLKAKVQIQPVASRLVQSDADTTIDR
jgi:hypothetical protein